MILDDRRRPLLRAKWRVGENAQAKKEDLKYEDDDANNNCAVNRRCIVVVPMSNGVQRAHPLIKK